MAGIRISPLDEIALREFEEAAFAKVAEEVDRGERSPGLWAKAIARSEGDTERARALYIDYRAQSIVDLWVKEGAAEEAERKAEEQRARARGDIPNHPAFRAAEVGDVQRLKKEIEAGFDTDNRNRFGSTLLIVAAVNGQTDAVFFLLSIGMNPSRKNKNGRTAAVMARRMGFEDIAKMIEKHAAV